MRAIQVIMSINENKESSVEVRLTRVARKCAKGDNAETDRSLRWFVGPAVKSRRTVTFVERYPLAFV